MKHCRRIYSQSGFTLIEILIAVIVLALGLLGLAGLQATGMRNNTSSYLRSQATFLAYDMADRIRANRQNALDGHYNMTLKDTPTGTTLADLDKQEWKVLLGDRLPSGNGSVASNQIGTKTIFTITVEWDDSRGEEPLQSFAFNTEL